ncbi:MAG: hypothetical protein ACLRFM_01125 [Alphaproteobacteria bacterium]
MKSKTILFGATLSVLISSAAFAEGAADLTTRGYVDGGLSFVYQKAATADDKAVAAQTTATEAQNDVDSLKTVVGATVNDGLRGTVGTLQTNVGTLRDDVDTLQGTVSSLQAASKTYTGGTGITVTPGQGNASSTINLNLPANATNNTNYVFQSDGNGGGTWTALSVEDTWDATAEARITGTQNEQN